jgi:hypothetical protein
MGKLPAYTDTQVIEFLIRDLLLGIIHISLYIYDILLSNGNKYCIFKDSTVARLSLWQNGRHSNDYKFMDRRISEMFTIGATGILLHKYLGTGEQGLILITTATQPSANNTLTFSTTANINLGDHVYGSGIPKSTTVTSKTATTITISNNTSSIIASGTNIGFSPDATKPAQPAVTNTNIQDLLFGENRDRRYDPDIYRMRGHYQVADQDFDLSQFGLFLATGTLFMTFHYNDMIDMIGRKIMNGDVLELEHLNDYDPLNNVPIALKRFFVVSDTSYASEGFSPTWWPHLWRCKLTPMVDSQEYKDILNQLVDTNGDGTPDTPLSNLISTGNTLLDINDAIIKQAETDVPTSGYDVSHIYVKALNTEGQIIDNADRTADNVTVDGSDVTATADETLVSPSETVAGYLTGDGLAPDGFPVVAGILFPTMPQTGDFCLRTDYVPNRLFRYSGTRWVKIEDVQRTGLTRGMNSYQTQSGTFVNNTNTYTTYDISGNAVVKSEKQSLSQALRPKADN